MFFYISLTFRALRAKITEVRGQRSEVRTAKTQTDCEELGVKREGRKDFSKTGIEPQRREGREERKRIRKKYRSRPFSRPLLRRTGNRI